MDNIDDEYSQLLELAVRAAKGCALEITQYLNPKILHYKSSSTDPLSQADRAGEAIIKKLIMKERPYDGLLGEEGSDIASNSHLRWVFDPLDGTVNYLYKIPHWAISIACERFDGIHWDTVCAAVYDVKREEIFTAIDGRGAYLNGDQIQVNHIDTLTKALIATEFSYLSQSRASQGKVLAELLPKVRDIRSYGSSVLDLCWVAAGRVDGFYESELSRWDWSAACLIVKEAGGSVSPFHTGVIASTPFLHASLCDLVQYTEP